MIVLTVRNLTGFLEKSRGLIGLSKIHPLMFKTRWGIHTFGVQIPIDVLILDQRNHVIKYVQSLPPNRFFFWPPVYDTVIELPAGDIQRRKIMVGDEIVVQVTSKDDI